MDVAPFMAIIALFIGLPWLLLHYVTKWKQAPRITREDEKLLDELFHLARRLDERVQTVERLVAFDHPDYRSPTTVGILSTPTSVGAHPSPTPVGYDTRRS